MKSLPKSKRVIALVIALALLLTMAVVFLPVRIVSNNSSVEIAPQAVPMADTPTSGTQTVEELQKILDDANVALISAQTTLTQATTALQNAQSELGTATTNLNDATTANDSAVLNLQAAETALAADTENATLITARDDAQTAATNAQQTLDTAQQAFNTASDEVTAAQTAFDTATQAVTDAENNVQLAQTALNNANAETSGTTPATAPVINTYEVVLHVLNDKLLSYDNDKSTSSYIRAINTEFATITLTDSDLILDSQGNVTGATLTPEALQNAGTPESALAFSNFIGFGPTKNATDGQIITTPYSFDITNGTEVDSGVLTFNLYAKYSPITNSGTQSLLFGGTYYNALAYSQSSLAALGMLPVPTLYNSANDPSLQSTDADGLYGEKTATWENTDDNIGSIQFDFTMTPTTQDTDIIIVLDKSTSMPSGYIGNGITNWQSALEAVDSLAEGLFKADNSGNNRVALVQFSGNTINSFNFQNNLADFESLFVQTNPSGAHVFRDEDGNIIFDHDHYKTSENENPSADGTNYTVALQQAQVFAESRGATNRELIVLFVSDGVPEAIYDFVNPSNSIRAWVQTYNNELHHAVSSIATKDQQHPVVQSYNGQSVLASGFTPTIHTIGINAANAASLVALSSQTGGTHYNIGYNNSNNIDTLAKVVNDIFIDKMASTTMTNAIISDIVTDEFKIVANEQYPVTLQRGNTVTELTPAQTSTLQPGEYIIETIDYNGEPREQITANIDYIGEEILTFKFYIEASDAGLIIGNYPTNEEHTLTYEHEGTEKTRNDLGEPELPVVTEIPGVPPTDPVTPPTTDPGTTDPGTTDPGTTTPTDPGTTPLPTTLDTPAPIIPETELFSGVDVPEILVPLASALQDSSLQIGDTSLPLAAFGRSWALLNLILTLTTAFISISLVLGYMKRKDEDQSRTNSEDEQSEDVKRKGFTRLGSIGVAIIAIVIFILTEDMTLPMAIVDEWTFLMALIALVQVGVALVSRRKYVKEDKAQA